MKHRTAGFNAGFTLIELMVALAIVGILAAVAYPSYMNQVRKSRRADATIALESLAQAQERFHARFRTYTSVVVAPNACAGAACGLGQSSASTQDGYYLLTANGNAATYSLTATANGAQLADSACRTLTLNSLGVRSATNASGDDSTDGCW